MPNISSTSLRSPLSQARGLGSAKEGVHHFLAQRVTAVALVPLTIWFVISVARLHANDFGWVHHWVAAPSVAVALSIYVVTLLYHSSLGVQTVIEDYVAGHATKLVSQLGQQFLHLAAAATAVFSVMRIALGY